MLSIPMHRVGEAVVTHALWVSAVGPDFMALCVARGVSADRYGRVTMTSDDVVDCPECISEWGAR